MIMPMAKSPNNGGYKRHDSGHLFKGGQHLLPRRRNSIVESIPDLWSTRGKWKLLASHVKNTKPIKNARRRGSLSDVLSTLDIKRKRHDGMDTFVEKLTKSRARQIQETSDEEKRQHSASGSNSSHGTIIGSRFLSYRNIFKFSNAHHEEEKPLQKFIRVARLVKLLVRVKLLYERFCRQSLAQTVLEELIEDKIPIVEVNPLFDPRAFKAVKEIQLSNEAIQFLSLNPKSRTKEQIQMALQAVKASVPAFNEYPLKMQRQLISVCWYESFEEKRVIIRQGHQAESFYFILSGIVFVNKSLNSKQDGSEKAQRVARLGKGSSFGELALLHQRSRNATVVCKNDVSLLAVGREDFCDIFMCNKLGKEPEHICYLKTISYLKDLPLDDLISQKDACLFHYFRRGLVMANNDETDWIYVAKTGSFRVLTKLLKHKTQHRRSVQPSSLFTIDFPHISMSEVERLRTISRAYGSKRYEALPPLTPKSKVDEKCKSQFPEIGNASNKRLVTNSSLHNKGKHVVVQIQVLKPKDQFGLSSLLFDVQSVKCHLVSNGGECILISKAWFLSHASETTLKNMRAQIPQYPSQESLQQRLADQANWDFYKSQTLNDVLQV